MDWAIYILKPLFIVTQFYESESLKPVTLRGLVREEAEVTKLAFEDWQQYALWCIFVFAERDIRSYWWQQIILLWLAVYYINGLNTGVITTW